MNKLISVLIVLLATNVFAAPAKTYQCGGLETYNGESVQVTAEINYNDWSLDNGYATATLSISDVTNNGDNSNTVVNIQELRDLANAHSCASLTEMDVQTTPSGYEFFKFEFNFKCNSSDNYKLEVYCDK